MRVQVLPPESVTDVTWLVAPVYTLADNTSRFPPDVGPAKLAVSDVAVLVAVPAAVCTSRGVLLAADTTSVTVVVCVAEGAVPVTVIA
jgi:hypothetical protein